MANKNGNHHALLVIQDSYDSVHFQNFDVLGGLMEKAWCA